MKSKIKNIIAIAAIGAFVVGMTGCDKDDVLDAIIPNLSAINVVNQTSTALDVSVNGTTKSVPSQGIFVGFDVTTTNDEITISSQISPDLNYPSDADSVVIGFSNNCNNNYITDSKNNDRLHVMNLSDTELITDSSNPLTQNVKITFTRIGGAEENVVLPSNLTSCTIGKTFDKSPIGKWTAEINGVKTTYNLAYDVGLEVVVYDITDNKITFVPLISIEEALKIAAGEL